MPASASTTSRMSSSKTWMVLPAHNPRVASGTGQQSMPFSERERQRKGMPGPCDQQALSTSVSPTRHRARAVQGMAIMSATVAARANAVRTALRSASLSASPCRHKKREMGGRCVGGKLCMGGDDGRGGHVTAPVLPFVKKKVVGAISTSKQRNWVSADLYVKEEKGSEFRAREKDCVCCWRQWIG